MANDPFFGNQSTDGSSTLKVKPESHGSAGIPASDSEVKYGYFLWLCQEVGLDGGFHDKCINKEHAEFTFFMLACKLHFLRFKVLVERDENREADGKYMRYVYSSCGSAFTDYSVIDIPTCSVLEMLVGLAHRMKYVVSCLESGGVTVQDLFWMMLENIGIDKKLDNDNAMDADRSWFINEALETANERLYGPDGIGSFFPQKGFKIPENCGKLDSSKAEIWKQMIDFVAKNGL